MDKANDGEEFELLREHRELFERLAESDLPINEDTKKGLARLKSEMRDGE